MIFYNYFYYKLSQFDILIKMYELRQLLNQIERTY